MSYDAEKKAQDILLDLGWNEEKAAPGGDSNKWLAEILRDVYDAGRGERKEEELRQRFDAQIEMFKRSGEPTVFGRLEAYKEIAEILGYTKLVEHITKRAREVIPFVTVYEG